MKNKKKKGFTLTELIVVIVIIGVLAAVLIPSLTGYITKAQNSKDETLVASLNKSYENSKIMDDTKFYTAYDVQAFLKSIEMEDVEVANKKSIILFDTDEDKFVLIKDNEQKDAFYVTNNENELVLNNEGEFVSHISEYYKINDSFYEDKTNLSSSEGNKLLLSNKTLVDNNTSPHRTFIVSTSGLEISRVVNEFMKLNYSSTSQDVKDMYDGIKDSDIKLTIYESLERTAFYSEEGVFYFEPNNSFNKVESSDLKDKKLSRLFILSNVTNVDLNNITGLSKVTVFIPGTTGIVDVSLDTLNNSSNLNLTGNKSAVNCEGIPDGVIQETNDANTLLYIKELTFVDGNVESESELRTIIYEYSEKLNNKVTINGVEKKISEFITDDLKESVKSLAIIYIIKSFSIEKSLTIPSGMKVKVLYNENSDSDYEDASENKIAHLVEGFKKTELTIAKGAVVTVKTGGEITVCGKIDSSSGNSEGQTAGDYAQITLNGEIILESEAKLNVYGYIFGNGTVVAESKAEIKEPFIILDYGGGTKTYYLVSIKKRFPFSQYALFNIQCNMIIKYGAYLKCEATIHIDNPSSQTVKETVNVICQNGESGLILLNEGAIANVIYDESEKVNNIGKTIFSIDGKNVKDGENAATTGGIKITIKEMYTINSAELILPIPYTFGFEFTNGNYVLGNEFVMLPGSSIEVKETAKLLIPECGSLYLINEESNLSTINNGVSFSNTGTYPKNLKETEFIVDGTVEVDGILAGNIKSNNSEAKLIISSKGNCYKRTYSSNCNNKSDHCKTHEVLHISGCDLICDVDKYNYSSCWKKTENSLGDSSTIKFGYNEFSFVFNDLKKSGTYSYDLITQNWSK